MYFCKCIIRPSKANTTDHKEGVRMELKHEYKYVYGLGLVMVGDEHPERLIEKLENDFCYSDYDTDDSDYDY